MDVPFEYDENAVYSAAVRVKAFGFAIYQITEMTNTNFVPMLVRVSPWGPFFDIDH